VAQAAESLGVDPRSIRGRVAKFAPQTATAPAAGGAELRQEVERPRAENKRLLIEREISGRPADDQREAKQLGVIGRPDDDRGQPVAKR
jgi:hypothetical protein